MSTMVPHPNESAKTAEETQVSVSIVDLEENDKQEFDNFLAELRVNRFDWKDLFLNVDGELKASFCLDSSVGCLSLRSV